MGAWDLTGALGRVKMVGTLLVPIMIFCSLPEAWPTSPPRAGSTVTMAIPGNTWWWCFPQSQLSSRVTCTGTTMVGDYAATSGRESRPDSCLDTLLPFFPSS